MSWQSYVDDQLLATGNVAQAAICGHDGNIWAQSTGYMLIFHHYEYSHWTHVWLHRTDLFVMLKTTYYS